jgi:DNA-binding SARP family transcriptional activator/tetratricopeptide (TPR) repeat protein
MPFHRKVVRQNHECERDGTPYSRRSEDSMPHLSLSLLGGFEVTLDGEPITAFGSDKARALLAFLAVESARPHRRAELASLFWPELAEKKAAHNLSQTLLRLRHALREPKSSAPQPFLLLTFQDVQFNPRSDHRLDAVLFTELLRSTRQHHHADAQACAVCMRWLQQAADLYRGDLLAGFFLRDGIGFEEWQLVQQERLHREAVAVLARLVTYHEGRSEHELVQRYAGQLVALEPWHEQGHLQLMRALARNGQTAAALEQYANYQRTLAEEFALPPAAEVSALAKQIQAGQVGRGDAGEPMPGGASPAGPGDRRQVTALLCGHHELANSADPEGQVEQLARCSEHCNAVLDRYAGHRQPRQGAKCLVYFGYPVAHEDAARRAVRAGLAMIKATAGTEHAHAIGIHTGMMASVEGELVGVVPDVARGCQQLAEPDSVWLTADTEQLVRGWFHCQALGPRTLPGLADPAEVYQVLGESGANRLDWLAQTRSLAAFVGREPELVRLFASRDKVRRGKGQVVLISGEPGIGKSRLLWELRNRFVQAHQDQTRLAGDGLAPDSAAGSPIWLESHCQPYFQNTSLYPIVGLLEQLLGFAAGDSLQARRAKLDQMLAHCDLTHPAASWLLTLLLGLPGDAPAPQTITADQRERMREMWAVLLQKHAAQHPLVIVIEDLQWSDPTTVEWLGRSCDALAGVPCLVLLTCRPTFVSPWLPRANLLSLELGPLDPAQTDSLVSSVAGDRPLPAEVRQRIVRQTDGIPLFVEELTRSVLDLQASESSLTPSAVQIPATLRDSLLARLDYAGAAKQTAQWAAVLGREFSYPVLRAIVPFDERDLQDDLAVLVETDLVKVLERAPQMNFAFKHSLVQEATYDSLLRQTRQDYHQRVAETLENGFPQVAETQPEVLAEHYAGAGLPARAVDYWLRAGERATAQGATLEARAFFDRALAHVEPGDDVRRWQALLGRETALFFAEQREAQRVDGTTLLDLAEFLDDDARRAQAQLRRARYAGSLADFPAQLEAAEAAIASAGRARDPDIEVEALAYKVTALLRLGDHTAAQLAVEQALARTQQAQDDSARAYAYAAVALYYNDEGDPARGARFLIQSLEASRRSKVRALDLECLYLGHLGVVYCHLGLYDPARAVLEEGLDLANLLNIGRYQAYHQFNLGFVCSQLGDFDAAVQMEEQALAKFLTSGNAFGQAACQATLGDVYQKAGNLSLAAEYLAAASAGFAEIGVESDRFEAQATMARVALDRGQPDEARRLALEIWDFLGEHGTEGFGPTAWIYLCIADVVAAVEAPGISAREAIEAGYRDMMQRADKIGDAAWRQSFLENVPENRELVERWEQTNRS